MEDERVDRLLRTLREVPPSPAGPDFTARVLARLDAPKPGASANWLPRLTLPAVALAATLVVAASLLFTQGPLPEAPAARPAASVAGAAAPTAVPAVAPALASDALRAARVRRMLAQIRSEHGRLESDLRRLRQAGREPVLYVGGDEQVDLIVDLGRVRDRPARRARTAVDPAALSNQTF
jgi:hypothetical protein